jgi:hypothetical protein
MKTEILRLMINRIQLTQDIAKKTFKKKKKKKKLRKMIKLPQLSCRFSTKKRYKIINPLTLQ